MRIVLYLVFFAISRSLVIKAPFTNAPIKTKGAAQITGSKIELTQDNPSQRGLVYVTRRVISDFFNVTFSFQSMSPTSARHGDGFGFWLTQENPQMGEALGFQDHWNGLGVLIDTYQNSNVEIPTIQLVVNDGKQKYSVERDGVNLFKRGCSPSIRRDIPQELAICYSDGEIKVFFNDKICTEFTYKLPRGVVVSASALCGELSDLHAILEIDVHDTTRSATHSISSQLTSDKIEKIKRSFTALELDGNKADNLKTIYGALTEADKSLETTQTFVNTRKTKLDEILAGLSGASKSGLPTNEIHSFIDQTTDQLSLLLNTIFDSQEAIQNMSFVVMRQNDGNSYVVGQLVFFDYLVMFNGVALLALLLYYIFKVHKKQVQLF
ncbi:hypothetical protein EIN_023550 [Entamoeba invadens IP1]|uniref:hypothetical protein n=1 Tax=Entamoeba invadens IP1 TaxID=370355 RepID=UPI0002C3F4A0|nr:hypothetical protein EIN_023550 [Entamoeba invadens IP1]ELP90666.1 hypothetical protein EIN_023550 [Entamoeba invadens IP1]|eukprot:XP_004257437.1 hypothetical protein EIN_023550 [Entamoeba invadens IP1]